MCPSKFRVTTAAVLLSIGFCFAAGEIIEKRRFILLYEVGYSFGLGDYGITDLDGNLLLGAAVNRRFSITLGVGIGEPTVKKTNGIEYYDGDDEREILKKVIENEKGRLPKDDILYNSDILMLPIFIKPRFYLSEKSISPFIDTDIGVLCVVTDNEPYMYNKSYTYWGFYFNPSIGVQMKIFTFSLGYKLWTARYEKLLQGTDNLGLSNLIETYESGGIVKKPNSAISLKIGMIIQFPNLKKLRLQQQQYLQQ